jgi:glyoxylase-like metal-dependent hydrolase (beta-lactamase superfamily II)
MSRIAFTAVGAALLATALGLPAQAQQPARPQIETKKVDGTDNVYLFRNGNHQAIFIVTKAGVIATDPVAHGRPTGGQQYVDEIKKVTDQPIKYLIYSHHHYDHIAGGKAF